MSSDVFSKLDLLYVEDEPLISLDAMNALEKCGFRNLVCAYTLKSAAAATKRQSFHCAILDIRLEKGLDSIDLGISLADLGTTIILASGNGLDKVKLEHQGFEYFFIKPYDINEIIGTIKDRFSESLL